MKPSKDKIKKQRNGKPGPEPELLKVDGGWEDAVKKSLKKKRPPKGWNK